MGGKSTRKRGGKEEVLEEGLVGRGLGRGVGGERNKEKEVECAVISINKYHIENLVLCIKGIDKIF